MVYLLSDAELNTLVGFYGILPGSLSPYTVFQDARTEKTLKTLAAAGLTEQKQGEFFLSDNGSLIAETLAAPGICLSFIKKTDGTSVYVFSDKEDEPSAWIVSVRTQKLAVNLLKVFFSREDVSKYLRDDIFILRAEYKLGNDMDISLTYDEWLIFGLSQLCYMRRQTSGEQTFGRENEALADGDIYNPKFCEFLSRDSGYSPDALSSVDSRAVVYSSLCEKGVLEEENGSYRYTNMTKLWLDNDAAYDCIKLSYANTNGKSYSLMLTLRENGVTAMYDTGSGVRIISSKNIPFAAYLS